MTDLNGGWVKWKNCMGREERHKDISVGVTFPLKGKREDSRTFGRVVVPENKGHFFL